MDSGLLAQIQKGKALKKSQTNDRSGPIVAPTKTSGGPPAGGMGRPPIPGMGAPPTMVHVTSAPVPTVDSTPSGPQLGGLFANGMPSLRKTRGAAVNTGRGTTPSSVPSTPQTNNTISPGRPPTFNNTNGVKPPMISSSNTLPRNFKSPPPIPGRVPIPSFNKTAPSIPPPPPPQPVNGAPPPPPPPPPTHGQPLGRAALSPKSQSTLLAPNPGRSRSNSSPQRPVPPPPPKGGVQLPSESPLRNNNIVTSPIKPSLMVPPVPGRPRASSSTSVTNSPGAPPPPPPPPATPAPPAPPAPPGVVGSVASPIPPRSPLPPPPPTGGLPPVIRPGNNNNNVPFPPAPGGFKSFSPNRPINATIPLSPTTPSSMNRQEVSLVEGGGKYTFRPLSKLPPPRLPNGITKNRHRAYPSGAFKGNAIPINYSKLL